MVTPTPRILVVDDEPVVRDVLSRYLEREGFEVSVAADGPEALECVRRTEPQVVVLDLMLPHVPGLAVLAAIRAGGDSRVIILSARTSEEDRIDGIELGADDYVTKPYSPREVVARVHAQLRRLPAEPSGPLEFGRLCIDPWRREVSVAGCRGRADRQGVRASAGAGPGSGAGVQPRRAAVVGVGLRVDGGRRDGHGAHAPAAREDRGRSFQPTAPDDRARRGIPAGPMSGAAHTITLLGPITAAMILCAMAARAMVRHTRLSLVLVAIAAAASLTTAIDLLVLNHFMLVGPGDWGTIALISLYALGTGVIAAMIVARTTTNAIGRLVATAHMLGENNLDARAGDVHASPELQLLAETLDLASARLAEALEAERRAERQRRDLVTSISHDLRTPLANLRAMVEAITDGVVDDPQTVRSYSGEMLASIERLVEMVEDLFELSRMDVERFARDSSQIPLREAVCHAVDLTEAAAARGQVAVSSDLGDAGRPAVFAAALAGDLCAGR